MGKLQRCRRIAEIRFDVLVAAAADGEHHHVVFLEVHLGQRTQRVGRFQSGHNAFEAREFVGRTNGFVVVDGHHGGAVLLGKIGVHGPDARIVEARRHGIGFHYLAVLGLQHQRAAAVYDAQAPPLYGIYCLWCSDNAYKPLAARTVSMMLKKHADEFGLEHDNHIQNALGKRVNGFWGIEALVAPPIL